MFSSLEDWHYRHAALMAISAVGEGCEKQMTPILGEVVAAVLPFCQDQVGGRESGREMGREGGGEGGRESGIMYFFFLITAPSCALCCLQCTGTDGQ